MASSTFRDVTNQAKHIGIQCKMNKLYSNKLSSHNWYILTGQSVVRAYSILLISEEISIDKIHLPLCMVRCVAFHARYKMCLHDLHFIVVYTETHTFPPKKTSAVYIIYYTYVSLVQVWRKKLVLLHAEPRLKSVGLRRTEPHFTRRHS